MPVMRRPDAVAEVLVMRAVLSAKPFHRNLFDKQLPMQKLPPVAERAKPPLLRQVVIFPLRHAVLKDIKRTKLAIKLKVSQ